MNNRRRLLITAVALAMSGTVMSAEPPLATVYLNPS